MVKLNSREGKEITAEIKAAVLNGDFGDIFAPTFDLEDLDWVDMRCSVPRWEAKLDQKQFREYTKRLITKLISENERSNTESEDIGLGPRPRRAATSKGATPPDPADGLADAMEDLAVDEEPEQWPIAKQEHKDTRTDDEYVDCIIGPIPNGPTSIRIKSGRKIELDVMVDPIRYNPDHFMAAFPHENTQQGGVRLAAFTEQGREIMGDKEGHPELIVDTGVYTMPFPIENNFFARFPAPAHFEFRSGMGNRYYCCTVRKVRTNQHRENINSQNMGNVGTPPTGTASPPPPPQQQQYNGHQQHQQQQQQQAPPNHQQQQFNPGPSQFQAQQQHFSTGTQQQHFSTGAQQQHATFGSSTGAPATTFAPAPVPTAQGFPASANNIYSMGDWRKASGVAYAPRVDPNNLQHTPPMKASNTAGIPPVNLFSVKAPAPAAATAANLKDPSDSGSTTTNPQSGIASFINFVSGKRGTPPSATSSTKEQEPYNKIQFASDSPDTSL